MNENHLAVVVVQNQCIRIPSDTYEWLCSICETDKPRFEIEIDLNGEFAESVTLNLFALHYEDASIAEEVDDTSDLPANFFYLMTIQPDGRSLNLDPPMYELFVGKEVFATLIELHLDVLCSAMTENGLLWRSGTSVRINDAVVADIRLCDIHPDYIQFSITFPLSETT